MGTVEERLARVEEQIAAIKVDIRELSENHLTHIQDKLDALAHKISGRPAWSVTILISSLLTLIGVLATALLRR